MLPICGVPATIQQGLAPYRDLFCRDEGVHFRNDEKTLPANVRPTHRSLFDGTLQGIELTDKPAFSFQGHPEASPGPREMSYLFDRFVKSMDKRRA